MLLAEFRWARDWLGPLGPTRLRSGAPGAVRGEPNVTGHNCFSLVYDVCLLFKAAFTPLLGLSSARAEEKPFLNLSLPRVLSGFRLGDSRAQRQRSEGPNPS